MFYKFCVVNQGKLTIAQPEKVTVNPPASLFSLSENPAQTGVLSSMTHRAERHLGESNSIPLACVQPQAAFFFILCVYIYTYAYMYIHEVFFLLRFYLFDRQIYRENREKERQSKIPAIR